MAGASSERMAHRTAAADRAPCRVANTTTLVASACLVFPAKCSDSAQSSKARVFGWRWWWELVEPTEQHLHVEAALLQCCSLRKGSRESAARRVRRARLAPNTDEISNLLHLRSQQTRFLLSALILPPRLAGPSCLPNWIHVWSLREVV